MKIFMFFIKAIYWMAIFIVPAGIIGFIGLWYYVKSSDNLVFSIILWVVGTASGIFLAEVIRRKYGLDNFFGRRLATPDIDGGNILDEKYGEPVVKKENNDNNKENIPVKLEYLHFQPTPDCSGKPGTAGPSGEDL